MPSLNDIYVPSSAAEARFRCRPSPASSNARAAGNRPLGQFPSATVSFDLASGYSLGEAVDAVNNAEKASAGRPAASPRFQGSALAFQSALGNEILLIIAAIVTVYIVLGVLYESFIHPVTILSTLPSAGVGALLALISPATTSTSSPSSASSC